MEASIARGLLSFLAEIPDPRSRHGRQHPLSAVLALVCCAIMCGAKSYAAIAPMGAGPDIALMHRLGFTRIPPRWAASARCLIALDVEAFEAALTRWAEALLGRPIATKPSLPEALALDGKSARGSFDGLEKAVHLLSLVAHESGLTLAQTAVPNGGENKTNEHKAALRLLQGMVLEGRLVTGDAMFCQRDLSQADHRCGGPLPCVREREPTDALCMILRWLCPFSRKGLFPPRQQRIWEEAEDTATTIDKGHGRRERRTLKATTALNDYLDWPGVAQVGQIESVVVQDGKVSHETRYFITSASRSARGRGCSCSFGDGATGQSRIAHITCVTSRSGRMRAESARDPAPKLWLRFVMRRSAFCEPQARRISPRRFVATLPKSPNSSPSSAS